MSLQSSDQDSPLAGTVQTKKNLAMTSRSREKYTFTVSGKLVRTSSAGPIFSKHKTVSANKISSHYCLHFCACRLHLTPRPAPKIVLKSAWQSQQQQQQQQQQLQQDTSESSASGTRKLVRKEEQGTPTENPEPDAKY